MNMEVWRQYSTSWILFGICFIEYITHMALAQEVPPTQFTTSPVGTTVLEGSTQTLHCKANGLPVPNYSWFRNGKVFDENTSLSSTTVYDIKLSEAGEYHCVARNRLGAVLSRRVNVHVAYMNPFLSLIDRTIRANQGEAVLVKLQPMDSYPAPEVTWLEGDTPPPRNNRYYVTQNQDFVILETRLEDDNMMLVAKAENLYTKTSYASPTTTVRIQHVGSAYSHIPPKFIVPPEDTIARIGDWSTSLECVISARPIEHLSINWYKKRGRNRILIQTDLKYDLTNYNRVLTIRHPGEFDAGIYECEGTLVIPGGPRYAPVSLSAELNVYSVPALAHRSPANMSQCTGDEVTIDCPVNAYPKPSVSWYKNGLALSVGMGTRYAMMDNGSLRIDSISRDDAGVYQCFALNMAGEVDFVTALTVTMRTTIAIPPKDTKVLQGRIAHMRCGVHHAYHIKVKVDWFLNDTRVRVHDPRIRILEDGSLRIASVRSDESGKYTCKVESKMGNETRSAILKVLSLPQSPIIDYAVLNANSDRAVDVKWTPRSDGNSPIKYFIIQYRAVPRGRNGFMGAWEGWQPLATPKAADLDAFVYTAKDLIPGKTYQFHISSVNTIGEGRPSPASRPVTLPRWDDITNLHKRHDAKDKQNAQNLIHVNNQKGRGYPTKLSSTTPTRHNVIDRTGLQVPPKPSPQPNGVTLSNNQLRALMEVLALNKEKLRLETEKLNLEMRVLRLQQKSLLEKRRTGGISVNCFGPRKGEMLADEGSHGGHQP